MIIVDDMISFGDGMPGGSPRAEIPRSAPHLYFLQLGLFTNGLEKFDKAYEEVVSSPSFFPRIWFTRLRSFLSVLTM